MLTNVRSFTASTNAVLLFTLIAGCAEGADKSARSSDEGSNKSDEAEFDVDQAYLRANARAPIAECQSLRNTCASGGSADGGRAKPSDECRSEIRSCLSAAAEHALQVFRSVHECRKSAIQCVRGDEERETCRDDFQSCVRGALGGDGGIGDAGLGGDEDTDEGSDTPRGRRDAGARPGFPTRPGRDAGAFPGRPERSDAGRPGVPGGPRGGSLDAGTPSTGDEEIPTESAPADDCLVRLQECAERNQDNPEACADEAEACLAPLFP